MVHLFVVYGYQGAEEDADQLELTDRLLQAVLAEAQVVCVGQPVLIAGDLNADPSVIHCLAKGISAGRFVDLALAFSRGAGTAPVASCLLVLRVVRVRVETFLLAVLTRWLRLMLALLRTGCLLPIFRSLLASVLMGGRLISRARRFVSQSGLPVGWTLLIGLPRRLCVSGMCVGMSLGWFLLMWCWLSLCGLQVFCR